MPTSKIVKRTGDVVGFERRRIESALDRALEATGESVQADALAALVDSIVEEIDRRFTDFYPNVENVQDIVEKHLMREERYEAAKAYILYRADHHKRREATRLQSAEAARRGRLTVKTEDGRAELLNVRKLEDGVGRAARDLEGVSPELVVEEAVKGVYDGIPTAQVERALVMAATSMIELEPAYSYLAARLQLDRLFREVTAESPASPIREDLYRASFVLGIRDGVQAGRFDERLRRFDLNRLALAVEPGRDLLFQYIGVQTLTDRYLARDGDRLLELPQSFWMRVAMGLAVEEAEPDARAVEFYDLMSRLLYVPSTPTLFHAGTPRPQLSSCYLTTVGDDLGQIFKGLADNAQLSKWSGGLGNDWTNVRATGAPIRSTGVESQGVVPFLKVANDVTLAINRSGKRRGATCAYLELWHYDVEDFCDLRRNTGDERRRTHDMDTALWVPDLFMKRVESDAEWTLFSPDEVPDLHDLYGSAFERRYEQYEARAAAGEIRLVKRIPARQLWRRMLTMLFETGHPWITFKDPSNVRSPQDHAGVVHSSNLCTEITLNTSAEETAVCNLGSINLGRHVSGGRVDEERLAGTVRIAMRMLDNVVDINFYPTAEARRSNLRHRPVGLGLMGFQDALFQLDLAFESAAALEFSDRIMELVSYHAILASSELAHERGRYDSYAGSKWDRGLFPYDTLELLERERGLPLEVPRERRLDWGPVYEQVRVHGIRNSNTMAIAPTATISNIAGCYPCTEPIYKNLYVKANLSGEFTVINGYLVEDLKRRGLWNRQMLERLKYHDGSVQPIAELPAEVRARYREAFEVDALASLRLTAVRGKWIDQSQSHNVFLRGSSGRQLDETYRAAWRMGLKTTYYLRSLAASQIEKSTLDASYGLTQKRGQDGAAADPKVEREEVQPVLLDSPVAVAACRIDDPDCESCQ
ncbi:ribonucleoside-diphosphate reductase subunit alpha [Candidatus Nephthysia bennettiae]|uniref:Ribonucleoside-diphosphate reductase n=1 Tax=Candidatus Nephthysia bennettiae TaxID=3127016 RepID=A0A934K009_9BACT|nr:ribonucleoside-diphosphate reductase subunit alpha [Candidatus Dormibacteraeota bacterium]MBJ7614310.1 ribonucleoside-diphosphate reductase subunit alpha [Candidatus Dormibacteraeota bacterium]